MEIQKKEKEKIKPQESIKEIIGVIAVVLVFLLLSIAYFANELNLNNKWHCAEIIDEPTIRVRIESVWNNNGKISLAMRNVGNYVPSKEDVKLFSLYIDGVPKDISDDCVNHLNDEGSTCEIDTDVDFPTIVGSDGVVFIEVKPPFGTGDAYTCAIRRPEDKTC